MEIIKSVFTFGFGLIIGLAWHKGLGEIIRTFFGGIIRKIFKG